MTTTRLRETFEQLIKLPSETEWVEFKLNKADPKEIGEYISAISNATALHHKDAGYIVWGVRDQSHEVAGTRFRPRQAKVGNEELENWLVRLLNPRIHFTIHEFDYDNKPIVLFEIPPAIHTPISFKEAKYIRIGSYKKKLKDYPEKERELWSLISKTAFEEGVAASTVSSDQVLSQIDYPRYFELTKQSLPDNRKGILDRLKAEKLISSAGGNKYNITNLGAILFAKDLDSFGSLSRKAIRVVIYKGVNRVATVREQQVHLGYAAGFENLISFINDQLPQAEEIGQALREEVRIYPEIAIRELVANALIHQDFNIGGTGPMIEIFTDRIEITNPGSPLIDTQRFLDAPPQSRNDKLASFMRRVNICEERGSGIDKVFFHVEVFQLPAPDFTVTDAHTKAVLFAYKEFAKMSRADRIRACYQHAGLQYVSNDQMTNTSLRKRFSIDDANYPMASRIIKDTLSSGLIKPLDPESKSRKHAKYVPYWG